MDRSTSRAVLSLLVTSALVAPLVPGVAGARPAAKRVTGANAAAAARPAFGGTKAERDSRQHPVIEPGRSSDVAALGTSDVGVLAAAAAGMPAGTVTVIEGIGGDSGVSAAGAPTASADSYEGDDTSATARALPDHWSYFAAAPYTESHTFDVASGATATAQWDEDWYRFTLTEDEIASDGMAVLIEAWTSDSSVDPVVEVFRPGVTPALLTELPESGSSGYTDYDPDCVDGADEEMWWFNHGAALTMQFDPEQAAQLAGTYYVRVRPYYQGDWGNPNYPAGFSPDGTGGAGSYQLRFKMGSAQRLSGTDRYRTAIDITSEVFPDGHCDGTWVVPGGTPTGFIVVATGRSFPDALAGSGLCGPVWAPLLLTDSATLKPEVAAEIARLAEGTGDTSVVILGGTGAVSNTVMTQIAGVTGVTEVARLEWPAYPDRYGTAAVTALFTDELIRVLTDNPDAGVSSFAFIANGSNYPDALAASPMSAWNWAPTLLVRSYEVPAPTSAAIDALGIQEAVIVGGTGVITPGVQTTLGGDLGDPDHVLRIGGTSRFQTARMFAEWASDLDQSSPSVGTVFSPNALWPLYSEKVGLASGADFPDALAGGVVCGLAGSPLLLNDLSREPSEVFFYLDNTYDNNTFNGTFWKSYAFGGTGVVTPTDFLYFDFLTLPWWVVTTP